MTGAASSKGRLFHDFDSYKNQEWLRRRKLRIEQVKQFVFFFLLQTISIFFFSSKSVKIGTSIIF